MNHSVRLIFNLIITLFLAASLASCGGNTACIDADDFGFTKVEISSRYEEGDIDYIDKKIVGSEESQVGHWQDFDLKLSGKVLVIMIKNWYYGEDRNSKKALSAWCPWWGTEDNAHTLSKFCQRLRECQFLNGNMCYDTDVHTTTEENPAIINAPCIFKKGVGLYASLQPNGAPSPNESIVTMQSPPNILMHLGEPTIDPTNPMNGFEFYDFSDAGIMRKAGGVRYNYDGSHSLGSTRLNYVDGKLYFKILDSHYEDNNGQYIAVIKSGLAEPGGDIFITIRRLVKERLFGTGDPEDTTFDRNGVVRMIFQNIITEPGYIRTIRAALILYISVVGILFMIGSIQLTHGEVISRALKVIIISALLSPEISWDFFNDYLFIWMYEGSNFVVNILYDAANTGPGDSSILTFLTTHQIMAKLASLLFSTWTGWLYIIIYLLMLIFLTMVLFDATIVYLSAQVMLGLLIALAPIFIAFYLFEATRSFFENWLKQMIGYAIQTIIVSAGVLFVTLIIRNQIYNTLGFRVCLHQFPDMNIASDGLANLTGGMGRDDDGPVISLFAWWFPHVLSWSENPTSGRMLIPKAHFVTEEDAALGFGFQGGEVNPEAGDFCPAYECSGIRYPDLPFLDPNNEYEKKQMDNLRGDNIVDFSGLFIMVVCVYLLHHFNSTTVSIAKFLSGTTSNIGDSSITRDGSGRASGIGDKLWGVAASPVTAPTKYLDKKSGFKQLRQAGSQGIHDFWEKKVLDKARSGMSHWHANRLRSQAVKEIGLTGASRDIVRKIESKYGLNHSDAMKLGSNKAEHIENLQKLGMSDADARKAVSDYAKGAKNAKDIDAILAKHMFKKKLSTLSEAERRKITELKKQDSVRSLIRDKEREDLFKEAYLESYTELANKGKGTLSHSQKRKQAIASRKEKNKAYFDELKRYLSGGLVGSEFDEMSYQDQMRRTQNEMIADRDDTVRAKETRERLDKLTYNEGRDIQRPDFLAEKRSDTSFDMTEYDDLIRESIYDDIHEQLKANNLLMGDTYMNQKATDKEFAELEKNIHTFGKHLKDKDIYLRQKSIYEGDDLALAELEAREQMIDAALNAEIEHLREIKDSEVSEKNSILDDMKSDVKGAADWIKDKGGKAKSLLDKKNK